MTRKKVNKFIQDAELKKGALRKQLQIPATELIPIELELAIINSPIGIRKKNPTKIGKPEFLVTSLLWHRANLAYRMRGFKHGKHRAH